MSKKIEDSELQTLTLSPTNTNDDENSPFINPASDETAFPISPPPSYSTVTTSSSTLTGERRKLEKMVSVPGNTTTATTKPIPAVKVSTPPGSARITYTNERANSDRKIDLSKITRERPTPTNSIGGQKKDGQGTTSNSRSRSQTPEDRAGESMATNNNFSNTGGLLKPIPSYPTRNPGSTYITLSSQVTRLGNTGSVTRQGNTGTGSVFVTPSSQAIKSGNTGSIFGTSNNQTPNPGYTGSVFATPSSQNIHLPGPPSTRTFFSSGARGRLRGGLRGRVGMPNTAPRPVQRPIQHHTFHADVADVKQIEQGLLQLMEDFQAGNLRAFGKDSRLRQMEAIREQQERLAKLHFDVGAEQDLYPPLSENGLRTSHDNMRMLMEKLAQLSESIESLHTNTSGDRRSCPTSADRKISSTAQPSSHHHSHHHHHSRHHHHHHRHNDSNSTPHHHNHHHQRSKTEPITPHQPHHNDNTPSHNQHHHNANVPTTTTTATTTTATTTTTQHASPGNPRTYIRAQKSNPAPQPKINNMKVSEA